MDRTTKLLLAAIAAGLWANALIPLVNTQSVAAQDMYDVETILRGIASDLSYIESDLDDIEDGYCSNDKIC